MVNTTVTCLEVRGQTAVIGFTGISGGPFNNKASVAGRARIIERDGADDTFEYAFNETGPSVDYFGPDPPPLSGPTDCSIFPGPTNGTDVRNINDGGAVVTDASP